jgi:hypothetical protein
MPRKPSSPLQPGKRWFPVLARASTAAVLGAIAFGWAGHSTAISAIPVNSTDTSTVELSQNRSDWNSILRVARLLDDNQNITDLVLQLDVLDKPTTSYANAVYQVFARQDGGEWVEIYTNRGARLIPGDAGPVTLAPEVIPVSDLIEGLKQEFGNGVTLDDVEINCVSQLRYDVSGGGSDLRQAFEYSEFYTSIVQTTTTIITHIPGSAPDGSEVITLENGFQISFLGVDYTSSHSIWRYYVKELPRAQDLSNWVLGLPNCATIISARPNWESVNPDPNANITGIKWETGGGFVEGEFSITLHGALSLGVVDVAAKGPGVAWGEIAGPNCSGSSDGGSVIVDDDDDGGGVIVGDDDDDDDNRRRNCNQGIGNGAEGCDPGNSRPHGGSNDEGGRTPGRRPNR